MISMTAGPPRTGLVILAVTLLTAALCGDAAAKRIKGRLHARSVASESGVQPVSQQPVQLGTMHYYGGPKSPMWRSPVEN
jgi:hypothetical protein